MQGFIQTAYAAEDGISIHLAPTVVGHLFGIPITNTLITVWVIMSVLFLALLFSYSRIKLVPGKFQTVVEALIGEVFVQVKNILGSETYAQRFFPIIMTIFIFILAINWASLLPGFETFGIIAQSHGEEKLIPFLYPANTDLNITIAFTLIAFVTIELAGIIILGFKKYSRKFINFSSPLNFLIGIIELFSEIARLISFSFRLFGNIFAGNTLILVVLFFVPYIIPVPLLAFEIFVGFIQAFIFAILTLFFIKLAIEEPH